MCQVDTDPEEIIHLTKKSFFFPPVFFFFPVYLSFSGNHGVFEAWYLLVQCVHWVQVAAQLLVTLETQDCRPLLWLLTFYYHPTSRGHHRALQLVR